MIHSLVLTPETAQAHIPSEHAMDSLRSSSTSPSQSLSIPSHTSSHVFTQLSPITIVSSSSSSVVVLLSPGVLSPSFPLSVSTSAQFVILVPVKFALIIKLTVTVVLCPGPILGSVSKTSPHAVILLATLAFWKINPAGT